MWEKLDELLTKVVVVGCAVACVIGFVLILVGNLFSNEGVHRADGHQPR